MQGPAHGAPPWEGSPTSSSLQLIPAHSPHLTATPQVKDGGKEADLVAVDFYSRYQRPTAPSCERFAATPGAPACKPNRLRWCHTDLGANAISYQRFQKEGRRFGTLGVRFACAVWPGSWRRGSKVGCLTGACTHLRRQPGHDQHHAVWQPLRPLPWFAASAGCVWRPGCGAL